VFLRLLGHLGTIMPIDPESQKGQDAGVYNPKKKEGYFAGLTAGLTTEYVVREVLLGVTICFAQIPESVAFAFMANLKPPIAVHAAWVVGLICSIFGGRPGMINGATGAFAAIVGTFVPAAGTGKNGPGVELLFPSVMFAGFLMLIVSKTRLSRFITLLPTPVMVGFCNGLAIVICTAQFHPFKDAHTHEWKEGLEMLWMWIICISSMVVMEFLPKAPLKIFKVVPSSLVAIILAIFLEFAVVRNTGSRTETIGDVSEFTLETAFPVPFFIKTDYASYDLAPIATLDGVGKIIKQGFLLCAVGSIESLMTSEVVESFLKTPGDGDRTVLAMGGANLVSGFLGGMGGNAMIGLSTVNCLNGGRGRMAPIVTALGVMVSMMGAFPLLNYIPIAALSGVMFVVVAHTFKWFSLGVMLAACLPEFARNKLDLQRKVPRIDAFVIFVVTLLSNAPDGTNIAYAVIAGVAISAMSFSWNSGFNFKVEISMEGDVKRYFVSGPLFFTSSNRLLKLLNPDDDPDKVEVIFSESTSVMDYSAMEAMNKIAAAYKAQNKEIVFKSLDPTSHKLMTKAKYLVSETNYTARDIEVEEVLGVVAGLHEPGAGELAALMPKQAVKKGAQDPPLSLFSCIPHLCAGGLAAGTVVPARSAGKVKKARATSIGKAAAPASV